MKEALEHLYEAQEQSSFINMYTAQALQNRGLVEVSPSHTRSSGGKFQEHMTVLNANGKKWCERHFAIIRGRVAS
jgi:hypothetical protein